MWKFLCPKQYAENIHQIDIEQLKEKGIRGVIMDLDNTLVSPNDDTVIPEVADWIDQIKDAGFGACIVSNNNSRRGEVLSKSFDLPGFWKAVKPRRRAFRKAIKMMNLKPSQVAVVGDQVFTDILGGNRLGLYTILVRPLNKREFVGTMFVRKVEKVILYGLRRRGLLK